MTGTFKIPFYAKAAIVLVGITVLWIILSVGSNIIVPFIFSVFIAILVNPVVNFLVNKKFNRLLSIFLTVFLTLLIIIGLFTFISAEIANFSQNAPQFREKFDAASTELISWVSQKLNIRTKEINLWLNDVKTDFIKTATHSLGQTVMTVSSILVLIFIIPVYIFLLLYYKPLFIEFIHRIFSLNNHKVVEEVLNNTNTIIRGYLRGLLIEIGIVTTLNSVGLLILGVDYAILLGLIGGVFNLIPYIGIFLALIMSASVAFITDSATTVLLVVLLYIVVQFIDNNFLVSYVVASQVKINAIISILAVITGNLLWGIAGMFLSIPLVALFKVLCDHIESLKPWGYLLGDEMRFPQKKKV